MYICIYTFKYIYIKEKCLVEMTSVGKGLEVAKPHLLIGTFYNEV